MYPMSQGNPNNVHSNPHGFNEGMGINPEIVTEAQAPQPTSPGLGDITSFFHQLSSLFNTGPTTADTPISSTQPVGPVGSFFNAVTAFVQQNPMMALLGGVFLIVLVGNQMQQGGHGRGRRG